MKRILSIILTAAMLLSMIVMTSTAEDNSCLVFKGTNKGTPEGSSVFTTGYFYIEQPFMSRDLNSPVSSFDYTVVFDFCIDDYVQSTTFQPGISFTFAVGTFAAGYDFNDMAFKIQANGMMNCDPIDAVVWASAGYELEKGTWYEIGYRMVGTTLSMYVNGIEVLSYDLLNSPNEGFVTELNTIVANGTYDGSDYLFMHAYECDFRVDNMTIYSGDYDFGTGKATTTHISADSVTVTEGTSETNGSVSKIVEFCGFSGAGYGAAGATWYEEGTNGTAKVTYDRDYVASHVHDLQVIDHADPYCTTEGYDQVKCECGMGYKINVVPALGHLPGFSSYTEAPTADTNGVDYKTCNRCYDEYVIVTDATGDNAHCLYLKAKSSTNMFNGYTAVGNGEVIAQNDGIAVSLDIMPETHDASKDFAGMGASMGGWDYPVWVGYSYARKAFIIANDGSAAATDDTILAEVPYDLPMYEWANWVFVRDGATFSLYIDDELMITAEGDAALLDGTVDRNDDGVVEAAENYQFLFLSHAANIYLDNFIIAGPDYDVRTNTGVIYDSMDFNDGKGTDGTTAGICSVLPYNEGAGTGYVSVKCGRPMEEQHMVHKDMAISFVDDYTSTSGFGYAGLHADDNVTGDASEAFMASFEKALDFEYSYYFNASDWCTDETLLNGSTAYVGGYVNTEKFDSSTYGGFAGYDFVRQQVVIGAISGMWDGNYKFNEDGSIDGAAVDYKVEKDTWYKMTVSYKMDPETFMYTVSVKMNDKLVASYDYEYISVQYYIFYPNNVKCMFDNITVRVDDKYFVEDYDFTNGWTMDTEGIDYSGPGYSLVEGGVPTHVYEEVKYPASCLTDGYTVYDCSCGDSHYTLYNLTAQGHSWDDGVVTTEPTYETVGVKTYTCGVCGDTMEEEIPVLEPEYILGDANGDSSIDTSDIQVLKRYLAGLSTTMNEKAADINGDESVDTSDLQVLLRYSAGLSTVLG